MILIADSGSTKTHWALVQEGQTRELTTEGLNPRLTDESAFLLILRQVRQDLVCGNPLNAIFFYGAGCRTLQMQQHVGRLLRNVFPESVLGDVLRAGRCVGFAIRHI